MANLELKIEDNSKLVLKELTARIPKAMYAAGLTAQKNIVDEMTKTDATGRDAVDTGRLRASISFITELEEKGGLIRPIRVTDPTSGKRRWNRVGPQTDDEIKGRAAPGEVIIGSNVSYASYADLGTTKMVGHNFMQRGIIDHSDEIQQVFADVLEGKK